MGRGSGEDGELTKVEGQREMGDGANGIEYAGLSEA